MIKMYYSLDWLSIVIFIVFFSPVSLQCVGIEKVGIYIQIYMLNVGFLFEIVEW